MINWRFILVVAMLSLVPSGSNAQSKANKQCAGDFESCLAECDTKFADDAGGKAKCVPQCSVRYAACDAGAAYDQAKPWIEEQAKKSKKFFDDLMNDLKKDPPADPAPKDKSI